MNSLSNMSYMSFWWLFSFKYGSCMSSQTSSKKSQPVMPAPVRRALQGVGEAISVARRLRGWSQQDLAVRLDASVSTVRRMEDGYHGTALHTFLRALHVLGRLDAAVELLAIEQDPLGMELVREQLPKRVSGSRRTYQKTAEQQSSQVAEPTDELEGF
ncbi:helix-turn-helix protein [Thiopseudomonas denitrificans]|uniref:Helix-turn-helix protein n=1 Tax=Thiopseudomonas denitrificans TaxID=1501432 RepID=A0A4R6TZY2_9GAMM|nr:helix-turn-helix protein [Thiopseudomonas denitrificans]